MRGVLVFLQSPKVTEVLKEVTEMTNITEKWPIVLEHEQKISVLNERLETFFQKNLKLRRIRKNGLSNFR